MLLKRFGGVVLTVVFLAAGCSHGGLPESAGYGRNEHENNKTPGDVEKSMFSLSYNWGADITVARGTLPDARNIVDGTQLDVAMPTDVSRKDYSFWGWSETPKARTATYTDGDNITITKDTVLYAVWKYNSGITMKSIPGKDFVMGETEITQAQWKLVMGNDGHGRDKPDATYGKGNNIPMYYVSCYDAMVFCNELSKKENLTPCYYYHTTDRTDHTNWPIYTTPVSGISSIPDKNDVFWENYVRINEAANGYRLPYKEEFEYAAKGGQDFKYAGSDNIGEVAWYKDNSKNKIHEVKSKKPNGYGLYDMIGNVQEWCARENKPFPDPTKPLENHGLFTAVIGCSSACEAGYIDKYFFYGYGQHIRGWEFGFRVVRSAE